MRIGPFDELAKGELAKGELAKGELAKGELAKGELAKGELAKGLTSEESCRGADSDSGFCCCRNCHWCWL
jgi:hypothetical protein